MIKASDQKLVELLKAGDAQAFEKLFKRYWQPLYNYGYTRLKSREAVEGLIQEIFIDLWTKRERLDIQKSFSAYIYQAFKFSLIDYIRSRQVREKYIYQLANYFIYSENLTEDTVNQNELSQALSAVINRMPERCAEIFRMSRIEQYSMKEIAEKLGISPKTVENQISKALKILRSDLSEFLSRG